MSDNDWQGFEKLAQKILKELHPYADVKRDDRILGHISGIVRKIDVSIRASIQGQDILVIVDAKNYSRPADIKTIGEFASVIEDVGATKGILICRAGFAETIKQYALNKGIELLNLHDAQSKDWNMEIKIPVLWIDREPTVSLQFQACLNGGDSILLKENGMLFASADDGKTIVNFLSTFAENWNNSTIPQSVEVQHTLYHTEPLKILVEGLDGVKRWHDTSSIILVYVVTQDAWLGYLTPDECRGIFNYKDNSFTVSYLVGQIPVERDESWKRIDDPDELAINTRGTIITSESIKILDLATGGVSDWHMEKLD